MTKKTLELYKKEFAEIQKVYEEKNDKTPPEIVNNHELLANECIKNFPEDDLGYVELGKAVCYFDSFFQDGDAILKKINSISDLTKNDYKYIKTEESLVSFWILAEGQTSYGDKIQDMVYKEPKLEFSQLYLLCAEKNIDWCYFKEAAEDYEISCSLGTDYKTFIEKLNPSFNNIIIKNNFCLKDISVTEIKNCKEIYLLGENGVGKTLFLQTIINGILNNNGVVQIDEIFEVSNPQNYLNLFAYGISRFRTGLVNDEDFDKTGYDTLFDRNTKLIDVEWWLKDIQRKESLTNVQSSIKTIGQITNSKISLKTITDFLKDIVNFDNFIDLQIAFDFQKDKFVFIERNTVIDFENIADGYRSVLIWLCDLLKRLIENQPYIANLKDFYGVVLIDEIDMFLHPKWEYSIVKKLREKLPNIQWFFTTHSPLLILGASEDAVFYKLYKENGITKISEQWKSSDIDNMLANSIITSPLFDLETARMRIFDETKKELDTNINYWYRIIEKVITEERNNQKQSGKVHFSEEEIQEIVQDAITKIKNNVQND